MSGPNSWMSKPDPQWAKITASIPVLYHLDDPGAASFDPAELETKEPPNPGRGLRDDEIPDKTQVTVENIHIEGRDGYKIPLRTYIPIFADQKTFPVTTWGHHGGWRMGNLQVDDAVCRYIAVHARIVVVNINYRLSPQYKFPAALNDVYDTVRWIAQNAESIQADPSLGFILAGASAGANMAAVVSHLAKQDQLIPKITGTVLSMGWFLHQTKANIAKLDVPEEWKSELTSPRDNKDAAIVAESTIPKMIEWLEVDSSNPLFSPCLFPASSFEGLPPAYVQVAGQDPFRDDELLYVKQLDRAGVATQVKLYPGLPHAFFEFNDLDATRGFVPELTKGVKWLLAQS